MIQKMVTGGEIYDVDGAHSYRAVRQGFVFSPTLFITYFVMRLGEKVDATLFVDDINMIIFK